EEVAPAAPPLASIDNIGVLRQPTERTFLDYFVPLFARRNRIGSAAGAAEANFGNGVSDCKRGWNIACRAESSYSEFEFHSARVRQIIRLQSGRSHEAEQGVESRNDMVDHDPDGARTIARHGGSNPLPPCAANSGLRTRGGKRDDH